MKLVSWNVRGLGGIEKRREVRRMVEEKSPFILCLQETKLSVCDDILCNSLWGMSSHAFSYQSSVGASGGLLIVWDTKEVEVWASGSQEHALFIQGRFTTTNEEFYLFNIYAPCEPRAKQALWGSLTSRLQLLSGGKVCLCGDFNAVRNVEERWSKRGNNVAYDGNHFSNFIDDNGLIDLPLCGRRYTWYKGDGSATSKLDRFLFSEEWCFAWPNCRQVALLRGLSDHCPLMLSVVEENWGPRPVRMLKCWQELSGYKQFVKEKWQTLDVEGWGGFVLREKLKMIKTALKDWHTIHAKNVPGKIEALKNRLSVLDDQVEDGGLSLEEMRKVTHDIHSLSRISASINWQQARSRWLKDGDADSKFFHLLLSSRHRRNSIVTLKVNDNIVEGVQPIRHAVFTHFKEHFAAPNISRPGAENLLFQQLNVAEGMSLILPFTELEVKNAVWDCDSYKSPGPDGVNLGFIKDFWEDIKGDVMRFISEFHWNGKLARGINSTFIALIPKVDSPQKLNDFRPIALVGCMYKILSKVLANRLRMIIGRVVSDTQIAFVKERQILDGILIANEVVDEAQKSNREMILFKVDFEKAYDSIDWSYLDTIMNRMSFPLLWRKWIKECVSTAIASILVNGSPIDEFPLQRGLRHGDPLSPFLFLLTAEGLNVLMNSAVENNLYKGYGVGSTGSAVVSHLQFADDTLLIGEKSWANVRALRAVLTLFADMSGLKVNFNKSLLVGINIGQSWLVEAASLLNCKVGKISFLYLGLSIGGDPRRLVFWEPVINTIKSRLAGWQSRFLSYGGRLILLKSVLSSLPVYALSFFKAPSGIISTIESIFNKKIWGGSEDNRKIS